MIRDQLVKKGVGRKDEFRWRGGDVSRVEAFSDAVFAFSLTLLVVSLEVPNSFEALINAMKGFGAFGATFLMLIGIWYLHYLFFRMYGLKDGFTMVLNMLLMFVVMFYIYPLKFLFNILINFLLLNRVFGIHVSGIPQDMDGEKMPTLMVIYGIGFLLVFLIFTLLYWHAYQKREELELNAFEVLTTREAIWSQLICVGAAVCSMAIVTFWRHMPGPMVSGWIYFLIAPAQGVNSYLMGKQRKQLRQEGGSEDK